MSHRPELSDETYDRLVAAASNTLDEPERVSRDRPTGTLVETLLDDRREAREAAVAWKQRAESLEDAASRTQ